MENRLYHLDFPIRLVTVLAKSSIVTTDHLEAALASGAKIPGIGPVSLQTLRASLEDYRKQEVGDLLKRDVAAALSA